MSNPKVGGQPYMQNRSIFFIQVNEFSLDIRYAQIYDLIFQQFTNYPHDFFKKNHPHELHNLYFISYPLKPHPRGFILDHNHAV